MTIYQPNRGGTASSARVNGQRRPGRAKDQALQLILLCNVHSLWNKLGHQKLQQSAQREMKTCCVFILIEATSRWITTSRICMQTHTGQYAASPGLLRPHLSYVKTAYTPSLKWAKTDKSMARRSYVSTAGLPECADWSVFREADAMKYIIGLEEYASSALTVA